MTARKLTVVMALMVLVLPGLAQQTQKQRAKEQEQQQKKRQKAMEEAQKQQKKRLKQQQRKTKKDFIENRALTTYAASRIKIATLPLLALACALDRFRPGAWDRCSMTPRPPACVLDAQLLSPRPGRWDVPRPERPIRRVRRVLALRVSVVVVVEP